MPNTKTPIPEDSVASPSYAELVLACATGVLADSSSNEDPDKTAAKIIAQAKALDALLG